MPEQPIDPDAPLYYEATGTSHDDWVVYAVSAKGWHTRVSGNLSRREAEARAARYTQEDRDRDA